MPFKPGQSGNPSGRVRLPPEVRAARKSDMAKLIKLVAKCFGMTREEAKERDKDTAATQLEHAVVKLVKLATQGHVESFRYLMEVMVGKIPDNDFDEFSEDELTILNRIKAAMKEKPNESTESTH